MSNIIVGVWYKYTVNEGTRQTQIFLVAAFPITTLFSSFSFPWCRCADGQMSGFADVYPHPLNVSTCLRDLKQLCGVSTRL